MHALAFPAESISRPFSEVEGDMAKKQALTAAACRWIERRLGSRRDCREVTKVVSSGKSLRRSCQN